jgi:hypothetical protein
VLSSAAALLDGLFEHPVIQDGNRGHMIRERFCHNADP